MLLGPAKISYSPLGVVALPVLYSMMEARRSGIQSHPWLQIKSETSLGPMRPRLIKQPANKNIAEVPNGEKKGPSEEHFVCIF